MAIPPTNPSRKPAAGGFLVAVGAILGAGIGTLFEEATRGFLIGLATGAGIAIAIWLVDRRR